MAYWVRLWDDMPTDPKWRVIARRSGQRVGDVIAMFDILLIQGGANASERGRTRGNDDDEIAAVLDLEPEAVAAIRAAMEGKVLADGILIGWQKRQPLREDNSAERAKNWRERKRTQRDAPDADADSSVAKATGAASPAEDHPLIDPEKVMFDAGIKLLTAAGRSEREARSLIGGWKKARGSPAVISALGAAHREGAADPVGFITKCLDRRDPVVRTPNDLAARAAAIGDPILRRAFERAAADAARLAEPV